MNKLFFCLIILLALASCKEDEVEVDTLEDGLVAHFPFDGNALNLVSGPDGNLKGGIVFADDRNGEFNKSLALDGVDDYVEIPHDPAVNFGVDQNFSISLWLQFGEQTYLENINNDVISKWCDEDGNCVSYPFVVRVYNATDSTSENIRKGGVVCARYSNLDDFSSQCSLSSFLRDTINLMGEDFHHVLFMKESTLLYLFVDGQEIVRVADASGDNSICTTRNTAPLRIGVRNPFNEGTAAKNWFAGKVDELRIYNRALSEQEINALSK